MNAKLSESAPRSGEMARTVRIAATFLVVVILSFGVAVPNGQADNHVRVPDQGQAIPQGSVPGGTLGNQSDSDLWRQVRRGDAFTLGGTGVGTPVLVDMGGEAWRAAQNGIVKRYGGYLLLAALLAILAFASIRGIVLIDNGRSGRNIPRFTAAERLVHWSVAVIFIVLACTGLVLMFGKFILQPIFGKVVFSYIASGSMQLHIWLGPVFIFALIVMFIQYVKDNLPTKVDLQWFAKAGGFMGEHASSWKYNGGEKIWFWVAMLGGAALSVTGILLDFPSLAQDPDWLRIAQIIHASAAVIVIAPALGHIYVGTVGIEGSLESMTTGLVDENWAIEHHDLWAEQVMNEQAGETGEETDAKAQPAE